MHSASPSTPSIERHRFESVRRHLIVKEVEAVTPRMLRIALGGAELAGFQSPSPDDHIKVFFPGSGGNVNGRDYTPRRFDKARQLLSIDFALHESGPASTWARNAKLGDVLEIGGPRGSTVVHAPDAWWLLIGDETALPSIGRRLEEMAAGTRVFAVVAVTGEQEEQHIATKADCSLTWVHRPDSSANDPAPLVKVLAELKLPGGPGFVWIAAEREVSRVVRDHCLHELGHPAEWLKASAYWSMK